jgi:cytochrome c
VGKAGHQPDQLISLLGHESHAISPGGSASGPLVPDSFGERVFSRKCRAECHGRIAEGLQAQGSQLEPFLWSNPSDGEVHYFQPKVL